MTEQPIITPTPKQQFMADPKRVANHRRITEDAHLQDSINMALLQFQHDLTKNMSEANGAAAAAFKIKGALEFVDCLFKLSQAAPRIIPKATSQEIDFRA